MTELFPAPGTSPVKAEQGGSPQAGRDPVPAAVTLVVGGLLLVVTTLVCDLLDLPVAQSMAFLVLIAAASSIRARLWAASYVGVTAFALLNGFVEDREAVLGFHGPADLLRLAVLVVVPAVVAGVTRAFRVAG
jgi:hypothetical protein